MSGGVLALPLFACASYPDWVFETRYVETHGQATIHSWDRDTADLPSRLEEILRRVEEILELPPTDRHINVYILRHLSQITSAQGTAWEDLSIYLNPRDLQYRRDFALAHELAHWRLRVAGIDLPVFVEEGLADVVATRVSPKEGTLVLQERADRLDLGYSVAVAVGGETNPLFSGAPFPVERVDLDRAHRLSPEEFRALPEDEEALLRELGVRTVCNVGIQQVLQGKATILP